jgi:hypothetical protein
MNVSSGCPGVCMHDKAKADLHSPYLPDQGRLLCMKKRKYLQKDDGCAYCVGLRDFLFCMNFASSPLRKFRAVSIFAACAGLEFISFSPSSSSRISASVLIEGQLERIPRWAIPQSLHSAALVVFSGGWRFAFWLPPTTVSPGRITRSCPK